MARNHRRKGSLRRFLVLVLAIVALCIATYAKAYVDDQRALQHYVDTHTTAPATPGR
jgi:hypothetical protein